MLSEDFKTEFNLDTVSGAISAIQDKDLATFNEWLRAYAFLIKTGEYLKSGHRIKSGAEG